MADAEQARAEGSITIIRLFAWGCAVAIAVLSLLPGAARPHTFLPGRAEHFVAYAGAGFFFALGYASFRQRLVAWAALAIASGVFETLQNFVPDRSPSIFDAAASVGGLTLGLVGGALIAAAFTR